MGVSVAGSRVGLGEGSVVRVALGVRRIRRKTRKKYSSEDKIRIVIEGLRGDMTVVELCRKEGISQSLYYKWSKEFLEAGKQRLAGNTKRQADSGEVKGMRQENEQMKLLIAEL